VLPEDTLAQLKEIVMRLRHQATVFDTWGYGQKLAYGKGMAALFIGESGTGKTMSADIIAGELGLDLYRIDLASVVSKYIGETEKNLEHIFSEATTSNAILFFDEADAIFGKRGEINDSHDRYANLEVSYLLQRMERFEGITILTSNLQTNIDDAFTRRLDFIIEFPFPQPTERAHIWQVSLPAALPLAETMDWELLAHRFELAGGNIRNAVLGAAFLAAAEDTAVHLRHFLHATRREYQKLGRLIDESLFVPPTSGGNAP
jgi:SpoVK/Ycf46/Vps4 family AAA+-type ATPase